MKVLLVGNIANNSYNNAKLLRKKGIEADVLCYNYLHVMSQPEWEDADFEDEVDQFFPDWSKVNLKGFKRPEWFIQRTMIPGLPERYRLFIPIFGLLDFLVPIIPVKKIIIKSARYLHRYYRKWQLSKKIPHVLIQFFLIPFFHFLNYDYETRNSRLKSKIENIYFVNPEKELKNLLKNQNLIKDFKAFFPWREDKLVKADFLPYINSLAWFRNIFNKYEIIHACAIDPIYAMLATPGKPYIAFEHGTLRDFPFEKNAQGRLLSLAYRKARKVIITNPDTIASAKKMGLKNYVFIPHPLDENKYLPNKTSLFNELKAKHNVDYILFCPARHDWGIKGNDIIFKGFTEVLKKDKKKILLILTLWGNDIEKSKKLIAKLGIEVHVHWVPVLNEIRHIEYLNASDIILDQMILPGFGGIGYQGMSCGKPVLTSYRHDVNQWCLKDPPPLVSVFNEEDLCEKIHELLDSQRLREEIGQEGREWILNCHSSELISEKLIRVYKECLEGREDEKGDS